MTNKDTLIAAGNLLLDRNLVWSSDLDNIRKQLGAWMHIEAERGLYANQFAIVIAERLLRETNAGKPN